MTDDFDDLETGASCYVLNNATSIYSYKSNSRKTYTLVGGKWYHTATSTYTSIPTSTVCWAYSDITQLNSNAEMYPVYMFISFSLAVFTYFLAWYLFRRLFKWR